MKRTLVDSSVWISHFKKSDDRLINLLAEDAVLIHPFILQELYLGRPRGKEFIFDLLSKLPTLQILSTTEVYSFIEKHRLDGKGIGLIDTHLLGAAFFAGSELYTHDKNLKRAAASVQIGSK
jgi:predicted nucleic acid-binding protein